MPFGFKLIRSGLEDPASWLRNPAPLAGAQKEPGFYSGPGDSVDAG